MKQAKDFLQMLRGQRNSVQLAPDRVAEANEFYTKNFEADLKALPPAHIQTWIEISILQMLRNQGADILNNPQQLFGYMTLEQKVELATHLSTAAKLTDAYQKLEGDLETQRKPYDYLKIARNDPLHIKIISQGNPYVLGNYAFSLYDQILDVVEGKSRFDDFNIKALRGCIEGFKKWVELAPGYSYYHKAHIYYALYLSANEQDKGEFLEDAYYCCLKYSELQKHSERMEYVLNLGRPGVTEAQNKAVNELQSKLSSVLTQEQKNNVNAAMTAKNTNSLRWGGV